MEPTIQFDKSRIATFCRRHHIRKLALFGSAVRGNMKPDSDVDILVEFEPGHVPSFFRLFDMEEELATVFNGRKVEMRTPQDISPYFRDEVIEYAKVQYAAE